MEEARLPESGEVYSWTTIHSAPTGFEMQVPYVMAIVDMGEGVRLTAQIVDVSPEEMEIGMRVSPVLRKISQDGETGAIHYGYKFVKR